MHATNPSRSARVLTLTLTVVVLALLLNGCKETTRAPERQQQAAEGETEPRARSQDKQKVWLAGKPPHATAPGRVAEPLILVFNGDVIEASELSQPVKPGLSISPAMNGDWRWENRRELLFIPRDSWNQYNTYKISIDASFPPAQIELASYVYEFRPLPWQPSTAEVVTGKTEEPLRLWVSVTPPSPKPAAKDALPNPVRISFNAAAAPVENVGKTVEQGVTIAPEVAGSWTWSADNQLSFTPEKDWPLAASYTVTIDRGILAPGTALPQNQYSFTTSSYLLGIEQAQFYPEPMNPKVKRVLATIKASHEIDKSSLERHLSLNLVPASVKAFSDGTTSRSFGFKVNYDEFAREAYVQSEPIPLPDTNAIMQLSVLPGVASAAGGPATTKEIRHDVAVPGSDSYFRIDAVTPDAVENEKHDLDQVLIIRTTAKVSPEALFNHLRVYLLPKTRPDPVKPEKKTRVWLNAREVTPEVLAESAPLPLKLLPAEADYTATVSLKHNGEPGRYIYVEIEKGLRSQDDFELTRPYQGIARLKKTPPQVRIQHDGSLLSLSGEKKISVMARDVQSLQIEIARLLPKTVNYLVTQTSGDFQRPQWNNYYFGADDISERFTETRQLPQIEPGKSNYTAIDFSSFLTKQNVPRGLFLIEITGTTSGQNAEDEEVGEEDAASEQTSEGEEESTYEEEGSETNSYQDKRLLLVTDVGFLVKDAFDGSHDVFVQSIRTGLPLSGAQVQVLGRNGLPVLTKTAGEDGHVSFPPLSSFEREKEPIAYLVQNKEDFSFLTYNRSDRYFNFSRFDVGGVTTQSDAPGIQAYLFSDRGVYRPGEDIRIGMIIKPDDWKQDLSGVPLEAVVTDPRGLEIAKRRVKFGPAGFEELSQTTQENSPTGKYSFALYVLKNKERGGLLGSTTVRVEEFLPDRMVISSRFSGAEKKGWISPLDLKAEVTLFNLFGTPAIGRRITGALSLAPAFLGFPGFKDYSFYDPKRTQTSFSETLTEQRTTEEGHAEFALNLSRFADATYRMTFTAQGFEAEGGRFVGTESSAIVSSLPFLVGFMPEQDLSFIKRGVEASIQLIAVDPDLRKISAANLTAVTVEVKNVSVLTQQPDGRYTYQSVRKEFPVKTEPLTIGESGTRHLLFTDAPGSYLFVVKDDKNLELNKIEYSVIGEANLTPNMEKNAELEVKLNKKDYLPGESIELQIKAPYSGAGLITIERDKVLAFKWFKTEHNTTLEQIAVPHDLEGDAYINVSFVRSIDSPEIYTSPVSYGVQPFSVSRKARTAAMSLTVPELVKPGETLPIRYSSSKPSRMAVYLVDEGILQVARYKTPDPLAYFFRKRALEVRTAQILDLILPEFSLQKALSAAGGDEEGALAKHLNPFKRKRLAPVVYWSGILDAGPEEQELTYQVPDYFNGAVRVFAVAVNSDSIGVVEKKTLVRNDLILLPNAPTVTAPGDDFQVSVSISNNIPGSGKEAKVAIGLKTSEHLQIQGDAEQTIAVPERGESAVVFKVKANSLLGSGSLAFAAQSGDSRAAYTIDLSVRPPSALRTTVESSRLVHGTQEMPLDRRIYPLFASNELVASASILGVVRGLGKYLEAYPYGCTEQLTSKAFPALILRDYPEFGYSPETVKKNLDAAMRILASRQTADGGFGFWSPRSYVDSWQTAYAVHFLLEAKERGYPVQEAVLGNALDYLRRMLESRTLYSIDDARTAAYALYLLTRSGVVTTNYAEKVRSYLQSGSAAYDKDLATVYLAAAYKLLKLDAEAGALMAKVSLKDPVLVNYYNYYDPLTRNSQYLYVVSKHFPDIARTLDIDTLMQYLAPVLAQQYNSLSAAYALLAVDTYARSSGPATAGKLEVTQVFKDGSEVRLALPEKPLATAALSLDAEKVRFVAEGDIFYQIIQTGYDLEPPKESTSSKIEVFREYRDQENKPLSQTKLGQKVKVALRIRSLAGSVVNNVAIVDLLPGGFEAEIAAPGSDNPLGLAESSMQPVYTDVREDRILLFVNAETAAKEFVYTINPTNRGTYIVPPIYAEAMYDRDAQANGVSGTITVGND